MAGARKFAIEQIMTEAPGLRDTYIQYMPATSELGPSELSSWKAAQHEHVKVQTIYIPAGCGHP